jgi:hypothetical protein
MPCAPRQRTCTGSIRAVPGQRQTRSPVPDLKVKTCECGISKVFRLVRARASPLWRRPTSGGPPVKVLDGVF